MAGGKIWTMLSIVGAGLALAVFGAVGPAGGAPTQSTETSYRHEGVASCGGSTCHGRQEATGRVVRQNELLTWQDPASPAGAHSRAYALLAEPRSQAIAAKLGIGPAQQAPMCLGCHADPVPAKLRGARFDIGDGVGCESCHGGSQVWLSSHYAVGATHASNVAMGMVALDDPKTRAAKCLDCHFGSAGAGQFVTHRIMAAGHPRVSFELDLFTALQRHHDEDADYRRRKEVSRGVKTWAIGQAMALDRSTARPRSTRVRAARTAPSPNSISSTAAPVTAPSPTTPASVPPTSPIRAGRRCRASRPSTTRTSSCSPRRRGSPRRSSARS